MQIVGGEVCWTDLQVSIAHHQGSQMVQMAPAYRSNWSFTGPLGVYTYVHTFCIFCILVCVSPCSPPFPYTHRILFVSSNHCVLCTLFITAASHFTVLFLQLQIHTWQIKLWILILNLALSEQTRKRDLLFCTVWDHVVLSFSGLLLVVVPDEAKAKCDLGFGEDRGMCVGETP